MDRLLVLVRHGQSEWNLKNLFTGWKDPGLTEQGVAEAKAAGVSLRKLGLSFDVAFTSVLSRAQKTLTLMLDEIGQPKLETFKDVALNERDYGDLSGLNRMMRGNAGARSKSTSGGAPMMWRPPVGKASRIRPRASSPITSNTSCRA
jgi:bisphosphoglycerate-dependent phosphoglycerate mutase family 1